MNILGIETSCDETSAAVIKNGRFILSNVVSSSLALHKKYGGIIPEIASRKQLEFISAVTQEALDESGCIPGEINLISVTAKPGLLGSLLVGLSFAKSLSFALGVPLLGVDHVHSHMYPAFLEGVKVKFPFISLIVSGGHTSLFFVKGFNNIETLGQTHDDACGEAFDKVAKILGLGYPGGPIIEKLARKGNPKAVKFNCSGTRNPFDFSFSGIKTAVLYKVAGRKLVMKHKSDIAASFQNAVIDSLVEKSLSCCRINKVNDLVVGGGVAANGALRQRLKEESERQGINCYFPSKTLCMDNAAMVAGFGYQLFKSGVVSGLDLNVELN